MNYVSLPNMSVYCY